MTITLVSLLTLIVILIIGDKVFGQTWIEAQNINDRHEVSRQRITLRKNKTFRFDLIEADFSCFASGSYGFVNDTLILDKETIEKSDGKFTTNYLVKDTLLIPIYDKRNAKEKYDTLQIEK
jgi:hypothetical protein